MGRCVPGGRGDLGHGGAALGLFLSAADARRLEPLRRAGAWIQILAIMALFYGGQLMLRNGTGEIEALSLHPPVWTRMVPTWWLAEAVIAGDPRTLGLGALGAGSLVGLALWRLSAQWARVTRARAEQTAVVYRSREIGGPIARVLLRSRRAAAIAGLAWATMARDGELRTRQMIAFALPLSTTALGLLTDQYQDPARSIDERSALPMVTVVLLASAVAQAMHQLTFSRDHSASTLLSRGWRASDRAAVRVALLCGLALPIWVAHALLLAAWWRDVPSALARSAIGWLVIEVSGRLAARSIFARPILRDRPRLGGNVGGAGALVAAGTGIVASAIAGAWALAAPNTWAMLALGGCLVGACVALAERRR